MPNTPIAREPKDPKRRPGSDPDRDVATAGRRVPPGDDTLPGDAEMDEPDGDDEEIDDAWPGDRPAPARK